MQYKETRYIRTFQHGGLIAASVTLYAGYYEELTYNYSENSLKQHKEVAEMVAKHLRKHYLDGRFMHLGGYKDEHYFMLSPRKAIV